MERSKQWMVLLVATAAGFLTTFMVSAVNVALPVIHDEWGVSAVTLGWIPLAYVLTGAALLMPAGKVGDFFGRKRLFFIGMVAFTIITLAAAIAPNAPVLIGLRLVQGVSVAMLFSCTVAMVTLAHPVETRGRALGLQVAGVYLGSTLGPGLGGVITQHLGWRYIFLFVGIAGAVNCLLVIFRMKDVEWREPKQAPFDVTGSVMWAVALSALLVGFSLVPSLWSWILIAVGVVGLAVFFWYERRPADPVLDVRLITRNRVFAFSNAATLVNYAATAALPFLMPIYLHYTRGLSEDLIGLILVSNAAVQTIFSPVAGRLCDRWPARMVASAGMAVCVVALAAFIFLGSTTHYSYIIGSLCLLGLGFAFFSTPIIHSMMGSVDKRQTGIASSIIATMRMTGQSLSVGLATLVLAAVVGPPPQKLGPGSALTTVRISFAVFAVLCALGVAASLVGPGRNAAGLTAGASSLGPVEPPSGRGSR
jgi:EmrB/QacA subfamily drug resistance transporter